MTTNIGDKVWQSLDGLFRRAGSIQDAMFAIAVVARYAANEATVPHGNAEMTELAEAIEGWLRRWRKPSDTQIRDAVSEYAAWIDKLDEPDHTHAERGR